METSASFEARYAPSLYPTVGPKGQVTGKANFSPGITSGLPFIPEAIRK
jgi:hypothetical protein